MKQRLRISRKQFILGYRLGFSVLVTAAVAAQLAEGLERSSGFSMVNFFSYFTVETALFGVVTLLMSAYMLRMGQKDRQLEVLRGAATLYMAVTGIVYTLFLRSVEIQHSVAWSNAVLHYIFPIVMLFDWLYVRSPNKITGKQAMRWLIYPIIYAVYILIRGPFARHWYPYSFINVAEHGYTRVIFSLVIIAACTAILALVIVRLPEFVAENKKLKS
jgi:hypothetical protein